MGRTPAKRRVFLKSILLKEECPPVRPSRYKTLCSQHPQRLRMVSFERASLKLGVKTYKNYKIIWTFAYMIFFNRTQFTEFPGFQIFANSTLFSRACFVVLPASSEAVIGFIRSRTLDLYLTEHINIHFWLQLFILQPVKLYRFSKILKLVPYELVRSLLYACKQVIVNLCRCYSKSFKQLFRV